MKDERIKIVVTVRPNDISACLATDSSVWGCGKSSYEAIGNLVCNHKDIFNIEVKAEQ